MQKSFLFSLCLCLSLSAGAADTTNKPLETVTVTASRTPVPLDESGSSVSIISREDLANSHATHLTELLREIPGFAVSRQGSIGSVTQLRVRGAEANQVLVMIDGIEANDVAQGSEFNFSQMLTDDIERVEIVRGPQSALWGSDALSGVVNIITRPDRDDGAAKGKRISGFVESGSFDSRKAGGNWRYNSERATFKAYATYFKTDGTNISRQGSEKDGYRNATLGLAGEVDATDNLTVSFTLRDTDTESEFDDIDFVSTGLPTDAPFVTETEQQYGDISLRFSLLDGALDQIVSASRSDTENINKTASPIPDISRGQKDKFSWQGNWFIQGGDLNQVLSILAEYESIDYAQRGPVSFAGDPNKDLDADTRSSALEYRANTDRLSFSASYRHDDNSEFKGADTWRLTGSWQLPNDRTRLQASVGKGSKNPTFTERFGFFDTFKGNPELKPETSFSWETGIHHALLDDRMNVSATWFSSRLKDEINGFAFDPATSTFTAENRSGESDRKGVELEMSWQPMDPLTVDLAYTWMEATEEDMSRDIDEVRRPQHIASLRANYSWSRANLRLSVIHTGSQYDNYFPPFPPFQQRVKLDNYTLVNLSGGYWVNDRFQLTARVDNLFDEEYEEVFGFQAPGISAYGGIRVNF